MKGENIIQVLFFAKYQLRTANEKSFYTNLTQSNLPISLKGCALGQMIIIQPIFELSVFHNDGFIRLRDNSVQLPCPGWSELCILVKTK